jgi:hypothetical protein
MLPAILRRAKQPILFDDCFEVLKLEAAVVAEFRALIAEAADDIVARPLPTIAAAAFINKLGEDIPRRHRSVERAVKNAAIIEFAKRGITILAAVKRLATIEFRLRGMA